MTEPNKELKEPLPKRAGDIATYLKNHLDIKDDLKNWPEYFAMLEKHKVFSFAGNKPLLSEIINQKKSLAHIVTVLLKEINDSIMIGVTIENPLKTIKDNSNYVLNMLLGVCLKSTEIKDYNEIKLALEQIPTADPNIKIAFLTAQIQLNHKPFNTKNNAQFLEVIDAAKLNHEQNLMLLDLIQPKSISTIAANPAEFINLLNRIPMESWKSFIEEKADDQLKTSLNLHIESLRKSESAEDKDFIKNYNAYVLGDKQDIKLDK